MSKVVNQIIFGLFGVLSHCLLMAGICLKVGATCTVGL